MLAGFKRFSGKGIPEVRRVFTNVDVLTVGVGLRGNLRYRSRLATDRAAVLADSLHHNRGVTSTLDQLPDNPAWWINTTSLETGKNWRFSKREMGDWQFGRHYNPRFRLADAAAASAGVPYAIGALKFHLPSDGWFKTDPSTRRPLERTTPPTPTVRLWDGGAYENLGLEAFYKPREPLRDCDFLFAATRRARLYHRSLFRIRSGRFCAATRRRRGCSTSQAIRFVRFDLGCSWLT